MPDAIFTERLLQYLRTTLCVNTPPDSYALQYVGQHVVIVYDKSNYCGSLYFDQRHWEPIDQFTLNCYPACLEEYQIGVITFEPFQGFSLEATFHRIFEFAPLHLKSVGESDWFLTPFAINHKPFDILLPPSQLLPDDWAGITHGNSEQKPEQAVIAEG